MIFGNKVCVTPIWTVNLTTEGTDKVPSTRGS